MLLLIVDIILLFLSKGAIEGERQLPDKLSNGDENPIQIKLINRYLFKVTLKLIDELPFQFQKRDFALKSTLASGEQKFYNYSLRPTERGVYSFGSLNVFASSPIGFLARKYRYNTAQEVPVYPSYLQLRKYD